MKKIVPALLILSLSGYVFFSGWISFWTDPSQKTVIITKTSGVLNQVIWGTEFFWTWHGILPTNVSMLGFKGQSWTESLRLDGTLPRSNYYSEFLGVNAVLFDYSLRVGLDLEWNAENLSELVRTNLLTEVTLPAFEEQFRSTLENRVRRWIEGPTGDLSPLMRIKDLSSRDLALDFLEKNQDIFKGFALKGINITIEKQPDLELYSRVQEVVEMVDKFVLEQQQSRSLTRRLINIRESEKRELLAQYGELLEKYPSLVTFLSSPSGAQLTSVLPSLNPPDSLR